MNQLDKEKLHVFFGDKQHAVPLIDIKQLRYSNMIKDVVKRQGLSRLVVLDQIHSNQVFLLMMYFYHRSSIGLIIKVIFW
jgi:hypothetical protein